MPFYEYQCKNCGHALEAMQKINDSPLKKCPDCGKSQLMRLMSAPVFRLKGAGWYETDFKGDQDNKKNLADRPEGDAATDAGKESGAKDDKAAVNDAKADGAKDAKATEGGKDTAKDAAKDGKAKEAGPKDAGAKDAGAKPSGKDSAKQSDKPAMKTAAANSGQKTTASKPSRRGVPARQGTAGRGAAGGVTAKKAAKPATNSRRR